MKNQHILYSSILAGCLALTGCGSDSDSSTTSDNNNVTAIPTTNSSNLTGLWLQSAQASFNEHEEANPADNDLESGDYAGTGTGYTVFQLTDNGDGTLSYQVCAGDADIVSNRVVSLNNNQFTLPAGTDSMDGTLPSSQTVTVVDNQNLSFTNFTHSDSSPDGDTNSTTLSNIKAVKTRDDISSSIGTARIGTTTVDVYCFDAASLSGTGKNVTDYSGNPEADFTFDLDELSVSSQEGDMEIGQAIIDGDASSNDGWAEYWYQGSGEWSDESTNPHQTVTFSSDFMSYTATGIVGYSDTAISINIDLN